METKLLQLTSGKGPEECERVVALVLENIKKQALHHHLTLELLEQVKGRFDNTYLSVLCRLSGTGAAGFCTTWQGTIQWTGESPFRKFHKRRNWFVGVIAHNEPKETYWHEKDVSYQTLRASGPGGQNVNKVESAVRATHLLSGISVNASDERSQLMNKKAATERLKNKLLGMHLENVLKKTQDQWLEHHSLQRGNPVMVFKKPLD